ncbi:DUF3370 domain-containing protein [Anabaenopsis elenkinii]|uniref:DUF3370 domain-containing protein n=1 Tax=Anabaenopsis elenkinii CCIBt3563 TaxID=2779889 RepID=A0A7S6RDF8_9CYAN|nr:DUF3370 domain-containing protein [Anabaenopsis elenkinii]QOV22914.1 DUF3370 domain-containing protein [Anabaenopsis elenkinii CCIBt3563]
MFSLLLSSLLTQSTPATLPASEVIQTQEVRPLPGKLDTVPVFNSNSPELVLKEGILLSTFPPDDKKTPTAHLNYPFQGRFDVFAHHVARAEPPEDLRSLYLGIMLHNPGTQPVTINILQAASYLSQPDAPFIQLPAMSQNILGKIFAGPGDRAVSDILRGRRQEIFPPQIVIPPGENQMLLNLPIPVKELTPPLNGRSTLMRLNSTGQVYAASMALFARQNPDGTEGEPTLQEWENLLKNGELSTPRDRVPTPLEATKQPQIYGRVAGVAQGSQWKSLVLDHPQARYLTIPKSGQAFSYPISSLHGGTLGTSQIQAAPMLVRYPDTAYRAHGNYGIQYSLHLPLRNNTPNTQTVAVSLQTPIKEENLLKQGLRFFTTTAPQVFFRGSVRLRYTDDRGNARTQFTHLVQRRGQPGEPLVLLNMPPGDRRLVEVDLIYPPDATPPQVLTISTQ